MALREQEMALASGQEFYSFEELSEGVQNWEKKNFVTLYTRSSKVLKLLGRGLQIERFLTN